MGRQAVAEGLELWRQDVFDPRRDDHTADGERCRAVIDYTIRSRDGGWWDWEPEYEGNHHGREWCTFTIARCYRRWIRAEVRRRYWASTYRLDRWARYQSIDERRDNQRPRTGPYRVIHNLDERSKGPPPGFVPQAGDIALVGPVPSEKNKARDWGTHGVLIEHWDPAEPTVLHTCEGNAFGPGPQGNSREGVIRTVRHIGQAPGDKHTVHVRRLIRVAPHDLVG